MKEALTSGKSVYTCQTTPIKIIQWWNVCVCLTEIGYWDIPLGRKNLSSCCMLTKGLFEWWKSRFLVGTNTQDSTAKCTSKHSDHKTRLSIAIANLMSPVIVITRIILAEENIKGIWKSNHCNKQCNEKRN